MHPIRKRRNLTLLALGAAAIAWVPPSARSAETGTPAPDVVLATDSGSVRIADFKGKVVYLDFWASWCVPCKQSFPWMNEMQSRYGAKGLQVVAVNLDAKGEDARRFLAENPAKFRVAFDHSGESAKRFRIKGMPSSVVIGPDGHVIRMHAGFRDSDRDALEAGIRDALARR